MSAPNPDNSSNMLESSDARPLALEAGAHHDLVAMSLHRFISVPLPGQGSFEIGHSRRAHICIPDVSVSALHARLTIDGSGYSIQDLGSAEGTFVGEVKLAAHERQPFLPGEPVRVGGTVLMVRGRIARLQLRRLWSAPEFADLVEDECLRAHRRRASVFAVAHLALDLDAAPRPPGLPPASLADLLTRVDGALPPPHLLGAATATGLEALLVVVPFSLMGASLGRLTRSLRAGGYAPRLGTAWYPRDGRTPGVLRSLARERAGLEVAGAGAPALSLSAPGTDGLDFMRETPP